MDVLAVIPARGGSKGVPGKNLRLLGGIPLVARSVLAARGARTVTRVVVSTDDPRIAAVSREHGAAVVVRPPELSGDTASSESALLHALEALRAEGSPRPELVVFLQCTSPFTTAEDVDGAVELLLSEGADTAFTAAPFFHFVWRRGEGGGAVGVNHDKAFRPRRQEREGEFVENGAVYVMRTEGFLAARHRFFGKTVIRPMPPERSLEIDEPADFAVAEALLAEGRARAAAELLPREVAAVVFDFDGVHTDNRVHVFQDGREAVACDRGDGMGISLLRAAGIPLLVLSTEENPVVTARCAKLRIECLQGVADKGEALSRWLRDRSLPAEGTVYVGNDVNDLPCFAVAGCAVAVADAHPSAAAAAKLVLSRPGGRGAVREVCDMILGNRRKGNG